MIRCKVRGVGEGEGSVTPLKVRYRIVVVWSVERI